MVHRNQVYPRTGGGSVAFHEWEEDRKLRGTYLKRILDRRNSRERGHHRHGIRVHKIDPYRELLDGHPQGPGPSLEVHPHMAGKRQQEDGDRRGGQDAYRTSSGVYDLRYTLCGGSGAING